MLLLKKVKENDLKRNSFLLRRSIVFIVISLISNISIVQAQAGKICTVDTREYPGRDPAMWDGLYVASDGKVYSALISEGTSAHFYVYDPVKDKSELLLDMAEFLGERGKGIRSTGKIHNKPVEDNEGNIYFCSMCNGSGPNTFDFTSWRGGHWIKYDPKTNKFDDLGLVDQEGDDGCYPTIIDKKRGYIYSICYNGYFYRFDIKNRISKNFGRVSNWDICRKIFCDDEGNVFMSFPTARVFKYDVKKEKVYPTSLQTPFDPTLFPVQMINPIIDRTNIWRSVEWDPIDKVAYGVTCGGSFLFKLDPHSGPEGKITTLGRICDSKFLEGDPKNIPFSTLAFALDSKNKKVYFAPSAREYDINRGEETFGSAKDHHLIMYDIKTNQRVDLGAMRTTDGRRVFGSEAASVGSDGTLYICGQVEVKDKKTATRMIGDIPVALHLIIYKPQL
jgi:hypothetical protein